MLPFLNLLVAPRASLYLGLISKFALPLLPRISLLVEAGFKSVPTAFLDWRAGFSPADFASTTGASFSCVNGSALCRDASIFPRLPLRRRLMFERQAQSLFRHPVISRAVPAEAVRCYKPAKRLHCVPPVLAQSPSAIPKRAAPPSIRIAHKY